jgi:hypothetical protein
VLEDVYIVVVPSVLVTVSVFVPSEFVVTIAVAPLLAVYVVSDPEVEEVIPSI